MVAKYVRKIEENGMSLYDVPALWREKTRTTVESHGYVFDENGIATKVEVVEDTTDPTTETV